MQTHGYGQKLPYQSKPANKNQPIGGKPAKKPYQITTYR